MSERLFNVGDKFGKTWQFDAKSVQEFATLAGDFNPLHHDKGFAEQSRFGRLIVSGTQYVAMMMGVVATYVSERTLTVGLNFDFQFKKAIFANEAIEIAWEITKIEASKKLKGDLIYFDGVIYNSDRQVCTIGQAKLLRFYQN